jgi:putative transposase
VSAAPNWPAACAGTCRRSPGCSICVTRRKWNKSKSPSASGLRGLERSEPVSASRSHKHERGIWQRRYWEHTVRDDEDFTRHVDYIHFNAVKHGYVERAQDWPYSSFHRMVRGRTYPREWSSDDDADGGYGEG